MLGSVVHRRPLLGHAAAFLAGAAVLYGALLAGAPWPPVRVGSAMSYERTAVQVFLGSGEAELRSYLQAGYEVESTTTQPGGGSRPGATTYILRRPRV
jgi:hypothetical protein